MLYPSREHSTVLVGENSTAVFNLVWYSPGFYDSPASFDMVTEVTKIITHVLETKRKVDKRFEYGGEYDLEYLLNLTDRQFGLVPELNPLKGVVWNDLNYFGEKPSERSLEILGDIIKHWKGHKEKLADLFVISGSPAKGYVSVRKDNKMGNLAVIGFHEWNNFERIKVNVTIEPFVLGNYPISLLPKKDWPFEDIEVQHLDGTIGPSENQLPPTIYYMTKFVPEHS